MPHYLLLLLTLSFCHINLHAYEPENNLKAILVSKIANFVKWQDCSSDKFKITIFNDGYNDSLNQNYIQSPIKQKEVVIQNVQDIKELKETNILFIQKTSSKTLNEIMHYIKGRNILTISDIRGFTEKGGIVQIYSLNQKLKIRINVDIAKQEKLNIKASLLRLADVVRSEPL